LKKALEVAKKEKKEKENVSTSTVARETAGELRKEMKK
jgi:hypothetical protein